MLLLPNLKLVVFYVISVYENLFRLETTPITFFMEFTMYVDTNPRYLHLLLFEWLLLHPPPTKKKQNCF